MEWDREKGATNRDFSINCIYFENKWRLAWSRFHNKTICIGKQKPALVDNAYDFSHLCIDDNVMIVFFCLFGCVFFHLLQIVNERKAPNKLPTVGIETIHFLLESPSIYEYMRICRFLTKLWLICQLHRSIWKHEVWTLIAWMIKWLNPLIFFSLKCKWKRVTNQIIEMFKFIIKIWMFYGFEWNVVKTSCNFQLKIGLRIFRNDE